MAMNENEEYYCFEVVWDYEGNIRQFVLRFFPLQESSELYDVMKHKTFMKRTRTSNLKLSHLNIGKTVSVLNRQLLVMNYADVKTRVTMEKLFQRTAVVFKVNENMGDVLDSLTGHWLTTNSSNMVITRVKMTILDREDILKLGLVGQCGFSDPCIAAEVTGEDAVKHCQDILAMVSAKFMIHDFCYASPDPQTAKWTLSLLFDKPRRNTSVCGNGILCLIKPHSVREGATPKIIQHILRYGFKILAIETLVLERHIAEGFLELYRGVVPEYLPWVDDFASGPCVALEVEEFCPLGPREIPREPCQDPPPAPACNQTYDKFRSFAGPADPNIARTIRPSSLRALFGRDKVFNGVHCTDLQRDCQSDLEFIFRYIARPEIIATR
ncbi:hypothetical protein RvY_14591 [Ramazzottius varieornatus]|uniref:DM10 domain-containing protein n=1 Tax=Ramazzottius varieornatus TaxID=947166 RepID=A0A1D1VWY0_RAMVA|nr:hypothetical protein RvY_14591 [Ramazzottius varieornatus]